ncbi:hypothetical protein D049_2456A, partial [Vibrio parahaemolyticus VPTS-2010]
MLRTRGGNRNPGT